MIPARGFECQRRGHESEAHESGAQKGCAAPDESKAAQPFDPEKPPKRFWGVDFWRQRMYTRVAADLYSGYRLAVSPVPGRHAIKFSLILASPKERGAIW